MENSDEGKCDEILSNVFDEIISRPNQKLMKVGYVETHLTNLDTLHYQSLFAFV
jgi:hypothetical protein